MINRIYFMHSGPGFKEENEEKREKKKQKEKGKKAQTCKRRPQGI